MSPRSSSDHRTCSTRHPTLTTKAGTDGTSSEPEGSRPDDLDNLLIKGMISQEMHKHVPKVRPHTKAMEEQPMRMMSSCLIS